MNALVSFQNNLRSLSDARVLEDLKARRQGEREVLTEILRYLHEVERRKLFLSRGFSSLFAFCMVELTYSERQAHTRIQAMRLLKVLPEAEGKIESGELSLSVAAAAQSTFRRSIKAGQPVALKKNREIVAQLSNVSVRKAERILMDHVPVASVPVERTKPVSAELTRIEFNANVMLSGKLEKLKKLTAHKNFDGSWDKLFEIMADICIKELEPAAALKAFATSQVNCSKAAQCEPVKGESRSDEAGKGESGAANRISTPVRSRYIPAGVRRVVWSRDKGKCQFKDSVSGRRCESEHAVQFDHIHRFSDGGAHNPENLRLMCAAHNQWRL